VSVPDTQHCKHNRYPDIHQSRIGYGRFPLHPLVKLSYLLSREVICRAIDVDNTPPTPMWTSTRQKRHLTCTNRGGQTRVHVSTPVSTPPPAPSRPGAHDHLAHPNQRQHVPAHRDRATTTPADRRTVDDSHHRTSVHREQLNIPRRTHSQREMHSLQPRAHTRRPRKPTHHRRIPRPLRNRQALLDRRRHKSSKERRVGEEGINRAP